MSENMWLARNQIRIELCNELVGKGVGNRRHCIEHNALDHGQAVAYFTHNDGDRGLESFGDRSENFRTRLFLSSLNLAQVTESNACLARNLAEGAALLQTEVAEHVSDFLTN